MQGLRAPEHGGHCLQRGPDHVIERLLPCERAPGGLRVESQLEAALVLCAETVAQQFGPEFARRPELRNFLEEIVMRIEEKTEAGSKVVDGQAAGDRPRGVFKTVAQRESDFLDGGRTRFADMIAADRNGVEPRRVARSELDRIGHQTHGRARREYEFLLRDVLLQNVVLKRAREPGEIRALPLLSLI